MDETNVREAAVGAIKQLYTEASEVTLVDTTFYANEASREVNTTDPTQQGGALYAADAELTVDGCTLDERQ